MEDGLLQEEEGLLICHGGLSGSPEPGLPVVRAGAGSLYQTAVTRTGSSMWHSGGSSVPTHPAPPFHFHCQIRLLLI